MRYVKVWFRGSVLAERCGRYLRVTGDTPVALSGYEVDEHGEEIRPAGAERRLRVIARGAILRVQEYEMDKTYATLVKKGNH